MLCNIDEEDIEEARLVLTLLCVSNKPLTVKELTGALAIDVKASEWQLDREGRSFTQDDLLDIFLGLIELAVIEDEDSGKATTIARIAHFSVQEYLESDRIFQQGAAKFRIQKEQAHIEMAQLCLVYLLDPTLSNGELDVGKLEIFPFARFAADHWFFFYNNSGKRELNIEGLILRLFEDQRGSFLTWVRLRDVDYSEEEPEINEREDIESPLYHAALLGLEHILRVLIASLGEETKINTAINNQAGLYGNALQAACSLKTNTHGLGKQFYEIVHGEMVQVLLYHGADVNFQGGFFGTALQAASYEGHEKVAQILLDHGADVNFQGGCFGSALQAASHKGHEKVVQILLDHGADVNFQGGLFGPALQAALDLYNSNVALMLLNHGADLDRDDTTLQTASYAGDENLVQALLDHGADINASKGGGDITALQAASYQGHENLVQTLLDQGADVNAPGCDPYGTALQAASSEGHENLVQTLLDHGADVNAPGSERFGTALQVASFGGYENLVQTLLDHGADVNAPGYETFGTALHAASSEGYWHVVQILLDHGADVNQRPKGDHDSALQAASRGGHEKVVQILLDNGAEHDQLPNYYLNRE